MGVVGDIQRFRTGLPLPERPSIRCLAVTAKGMVPARPRAGPRRWLPAPDVATLAAHQHAISGVTKSKLVFPLERTQGMRLPRSFGSGSAQARSPLLWHGATLSDRTQGEAWR